MALEAQVGPLRRGLREAALIGLLALALNLAGNDRISLWDRDEPRYAACAREMRASGDYVHPTFNGEPRYHKPVLIYWLMVAGMAVFGDNTFGARVVSAVAGAGTCMVVWAWGRRMFGARVGLLAGLILATAPIMVVESRLATTDATLTLFVVGCQFALWELAQRPSRGAAAAFWILLGLAILTKAPAGPALILAAGVASWWFGGPIICWARLRWRWGPALCALLVVPWHVAILLRTRGAYYDVAVGYHIVRRMTYGIEEHGGFPGYYLVTSLLTFYPWSALLPAALAGAWARRKLSPNMGFLLGWVIGPLLLLECVRTKLIHYYLPSFPAWALLAAWLVVALAEHEVGLFRWPLGRLSFAMLGTIGAAGTACLIAAAALAPAGVRLPSLVMGVLLGLATIAAAWHLRRGEAERGVAVLAASFTLLALLAGAWLLPAAEPYRLAARVGRRLAAIEERERAAPILCGFKPPSMIYALGHPAPILSSKDLLLDELMRKGTIIAALRPDELGLLAADPRLALVIRESFHGLDTEKATFATLHLALIRPAVPTVAARPDLSLRR